jgi:hypothetical protein
MGSLIAGALDSLGLPAGLAGDGTPYVPSAPVQIGTSGRAHHNVSEVGSWQTLIAMFAVVILLGAVVLMFAVRQRTRVLKRRRVRRMAEAVAALAEYESLSELGNGTLAAPALAAPPRTTSRTTPATPSRPTPNA